MDPPSSVFKNFENCSIVKQVLIPKWTKKRNFLKSFLGSNREVVQNLSISMMNIMCTDKHLTNQIIVVTILKRTRKS